MKKVICSIFALTLLLGNLHAQGKPETFLLEVEKFQFTGDWTEGGVNGQRMLFAQNPSKTSPTTIASVDIEGKYYVWASAMDYTAIGQGTRRISVAVNGKTLPKEAGNHGKDGFYWQLMGEAQLTQGDNIFSIIPKTSHMRADAILLTQDANYNPNDSLKTFADRAKVRKDPKIVDYTYELDLDLSEPLKSIKGGKTFGISNATNRIIFTEKQNVKGEKFFERSAEALINGKWTKLESYKDEALYLYFAEKPGYIEGFHITWSTSLGSINVPLNGTTVQLKMPPLNPYSITKGKFLRPTAIRNIDAKTLEMLYGKDVKAKITMMPQGGLFKMEVETIAQESGFYSFCFLGSNAHNKSVISAVELPTLYQGTRLMAQPKLVANRMTSHPLSLIETSYTADEKFTNAVIADPDNLPWGEWSKDNVSNYGFSLASPKNEVQTAIFQPILGGRNSKKEAGETIKASWYVMNIAGTWMDGLELSSEKIFETTKLREAYEVSFSDALANIAIYMKNEDASGWSRLHKGRWNIEAADTATHASPLSELSIALLTNDEDYYKNIALPTIEYTLSRYRHHFCADRLTSGTWFNEQMKSLSVPSLDWGGDYYMSVNAMLLNANPFFKEFESNPGTLSPNRNWTSLLGRYLANPDAELLEKAKTACDSWIKTQMETPNNKEVDVEYFINFGDYPYWWYLVDMYEITKDEKYLKYAQQGAFHTISSLWSYPKTPEGEVTINKNNLVQGIAHVWWKGLEEYRLGYDTNIARLTELRKNPDYAKLQNDMFIVAEKKVPAMKVARIGLGIEQHTTFLQPSGDNNILMPGWAPELLKVYQYTKRDVILKYSRHAMIGRFSNFLGYYIRDYTDVQHDEMYPYAGPDTTSFYYHHAPCHFGQTMDYLMTQIEIASDNKIRFPYVRQQGYVWFVDRIFGKVGKVFGEDARPMLSKESIRVGSPKISTMMARAKDGIWGVILNDSGAELEANITFDATTKAMQGAKTTEAISLYDAAGNLLNTKLAFLGENKVKIPAMSMVAVRIPAEESALFQDIKPVAGQAHFVQKNIAPDWGDLHAFRIRSPFGKDSIFVLVTGGMKKKNSKMVLNIEEPSKQTLTAKAYPYEFSVYPLSMDSDIKISVEIHEEGKAVIKSQTIILAK